MIEGEDPGFQLHRRALRAIGHTARSASNDAAPAIRRAYDALRAGELSNAQRAVDRAWRTCPDAAAAIAPTYAWLLVIENRQREAALAMLDQALQLAPDGDLAALRVLMLMRAAQFQESLRALHNALSSFCIRPSDLLANAARVLFAHPETDVPGWWGFGSRLEVRGGLASAQTMTALQVQLESGGTFAQLLTRSDKSHLGHFSFQLPRSALSGRVVLSLEGLPLMGASMPVDFGLRGRSVLFGARIRGHAHLIWSGGRPLRMSLQDDHGRRAHQFTTGTGGDFDVPLRKIGLRGDRIHVAAQLPDGRWCALPDSPMLHPRAVRQSRVGHLGKWTPLRPRPSSKVQARPAAVDVIVPVFNHSDETLACLDTVRGTLPIWAHVVVVDDGSTDAELVSALAKREREKHFTLLHNPENRGFVAAVNLGLALHPDRDVVLLNSDTMVFADWLDRLREAVYRTGGAGTATPLSNSGSIVSYPKPPGSKMDPGQAEQIDALVSRTQAGRRLSIPVGVGFCLYIRRDCLRDVGEFDETVFGVGYGEESDFCLRARRRGWSHWLAADVFVYHAGGASFGARRASLLARSQRLLNQRHPGYDRFISSFEGADSLHPVRRHLDEVRLKELQGRIALLVTLALPGGVDRYVAQRCTTLRTQGFVPVILRPVTPGDAGHCQLCTEALDVPNLRYDIPRELPRLVGLLRELAPETVEIQHFLDLHPRVIAVVQGLPCGYEVMIHDYAWICPRVTLIDGGGRHCGEPAVSVCHDCVRRHGATVTGINVRALRGRSEAWLRGARRVTAPSADTARRLRRYFTKLDIQVEPHTAVFPAPHAAWPAAEGARLRVALIGAIGTHKGYDVLLACARDAHRRKLPLEFVVVGYTSNDAALLRTGRVFVTGRYTEAEVPHLLQRERPGVLWLPSVWPETWCYTLDHAFATGLPIVAFDIGAVAERLRAAQYGVLVPLALTAPALNEQLLEAGRSRGGEAHLFERHQPRLRSEPDAYKMIATSRGELEMNKAPKDVTSAQQEGLGASVQVLPLPVGLYLFSVTAAAPNRAMTDGLTLPAVHVVPAPGTDARNVEFINGPGTNSPWLVAPGDLLIARISGAETTLLVTSVRAAGGEALAIKIERLDARGAVSAGIAASAPVLAPASAAIKTAVATPVAAVVSVDGEIPLQIGAHIRSRGDMAFTAVPWAGRVARGLWIESFSIQPLALLTDQDLEYKGLTASGFETPWISEQKMCGTRGMAVPLVGFAIRLKKGDASAGYDCEYSGYFQSGATVGPLRNGAPCRSNVANDPLEGIQVRLIRRAAAVGTAPASRPAARAARAGRRS